MARAEPITTHRIHIVAHEKHRGFWAAFNATDPNHRPWFFRDLHPYKATITTRISKQDALSGLE